MKNLSPRLRRIIYLVISLVLVIITTNPATMFFLPSSAKESLTDIWGRMFGNVSDVTNTLRIDWISIFQIIIVVLTMVLLTNVIRYIIERVEPKSGKMQSIFSMVDSFLSYASSIIGLVWCLSAIGINLSTIFASIGIVALVIGFAAESLISDIITGIFLVFEDDFNVGDIVELNGFRGTVTSIGVRVTCIKDGGGNLKIINNSDLRDILNRSKAASLAVCDAPVSYNANLEEVEEILGKILAELPEKYPDTFSMPPVYLGVQALSASSVDLRVCAEVSEENLFSATRIMNREIKIGFDKAGVEIPYQQLVVHKAEG